LVFSFFFLHLSVSVFSFPSSSLHFLLPAFLHSVKPLSPYISSPPSFFLPFLTVSLFRIYFPHALYLSQPLDIYQMSYETNKSIQYSSISQVR
jgi:hypothetical protein